MPGQIHTIVDEDGVDRQPCVWSWHRWSRRSRPWLTSNGRRGDDAAGGGFLHEGSTLLVVMNGLRLLAYGGGDPLATG